MSEHIGEIKFTPESEWGKRLVELEVLNEADGAPITLDRLATLDVRIPILYNHDGTITTGELSVDSMAL